MVENEIVTKNETLCKLNNNEFGDDCPEQGQARLRRAITTNNCRTKKHRSRDRSVVKVIFDECQELGYINSSLIITH